MSLEDKKNDGLINIHIHPSINNVFTYIFHCSLQGIVPTYLLQFLLPIK